MSGMSDWYRSRGRKKVAVQASPRCRRSSTAGFAMIDNDLLRIGQLVADARSELEEAQHSPERTIAVSKGTLFKLRRGAVFADDRPPLVLSPLHPLSSGAQTARTRPPLQSVDRIPTPPLTARQDRRPLRMTQMPTPPSRQRPPVGEAVRRHMKGELFGCWQDLLDECYAASADEALAVSWVDQTVQEVIRDATKVKARAAKAARTNEKMLRAVNLVQAALLGLYTRKIVSVAQTEQSAAAQEVLPEPRSLRGSELRGSEHSVINYLNAKYTDDLVDLREATATTLVLAGDAFSQFDKLPQWLESWSEIKAAKVPSPGSCFKVAELPEVAQVDEVLALCEEVLADRQQTREASTLCTSLCAVLTKLREVLVGLTESTPTRMRELPLEAVLKPLHLHGGERGAELIALLGKARQLKSVFEDYEEERERMKDCEATVLGFVKQYLISSDLSNAADFSVGYEQLVLERFKLEVRGLLNQSLQVGDELTEVLNANSHDTSVLVLWKGCVAGLMHNAQREAAKVQARCDALAQCQVESIALTQKLLSVQSEVSEVTLVDGWPCGHRVTQAMVACAELMSLMNEHHLKQIETAGGGRAVDDVMLHLLHPEQCTLEALEQTRAAFSEQREELLNMHVFDAAIVACRVSEGFDELYFCKLTSLCLEEASLFAELARESVVVDAYFDVFLPDCELLAAKLSAMTESWLVTCSLKLAPGTGLQLASWKECIQTVQRLMSIAESSCSQRIVRQGRQLNLPKGLAKLQRGAEAMEIGSEARTGHKLLLEVLSLIASHLSESLSALSSKTGAKLDSTLAELTKCRVLLTGRPTHLSMQMVGVRVKLLEGSLIAMGHEIAARTAAQMHQLAMFLCEDLLLQQHTEVLRSFKREIDTAVTAVGAETAHLGKCKHLYDKPSTQDNLAQLHRSIFAAGNFLHVYDCQLLSHQMLPVLMEAMHIGQGIVLRHQMDGFTAKASQVQHLLDPCLATFDQPLIAEEAVNVYARVADKLSAFLTALANSRSVLYIDYNDTVQSAVTRLNRLSEQDPWEKPSAPTRPHPEHTLPELMTAMSQALRADGLTIAADKCMALAASDANADYSTIVELTRLGTLRTGPQIATQSIVVDEERLSTQMAKWGSNASGSASETSSEAWSETGEYSHAKGFTLSSTSVSSSYAKCVSAINARLEQEQEDGKWALRSRLDKQMADALLTLSEHVKVYQATDQTPSDNKTSQFSKHSKVRAAYVSRLRSQLPKPASRVRRETMLALERRGSLQVSPRRDSVKAQRSKSLIDSNTTELSPSGLQDSKAPLRRLSSRPEESDPLSPQRRKSVRRRRTQTVSKVAPVPEMPRPSVYDPHDLSPRQTEAKMQLFGWLYKKKKRLMPSEHQPSKPREGVLDWAEQDAAATKIQAFFRGTVARAPVDRTFSQTKRGRARDSSTVVGHSKKWDPT